MTNRDQIIELSDPKTGPALCRRHVFSAAREMGFAERQAWEIVAAVFEACANAIVHGTHGGQDGRVVLRIRTDGSRFEATVTDSGAGFACPVNTPIPPPTSHRGRGIPLMRKFMDEVRFESRDGCTATLIKYLPTKGT